ncbi:Pimeloyl-ACP methyl ester carboxylesterase [Novosphingobium sp. CF614]|uniref:alpha/beta fold hydrolase n=1 Tax=Novosphingobium sp. CF614 TaxID=1884364 RepID=UPI0008E210D2|nr:alpha/beta fold hydrolase [Novosphingobium sp. CF614]SFG44663.1 Pimeloyl-ACP methyl ester carboxylesterase [Novosphingobium sp. CF614]
MATFILIHGSWHGSWCFDEVKALLEAEGHHVMAPDLPGMGGDEVSLGAATLQGWADFAAGLCRAAPERPVVLAGHSRGGLVVSQAAETAPDAMDALVYICAMMLPSGMSRMQFKQLVGPNPPLDALIKPTPGGQGTVIVGERPGAVFAQRSPPDKVAAAMMRLVAEPHGPRSEPLRLTPERFGRLPRTYIECSEDQVIPLSSQHRMQELVPGARVEQLWADHSPFLSRPVTLARLLIEAIPQNATATADQPGAEL